MKTDAAVQERTEWEVRHTPSPHGLGYDHDADVKCWLMWHPDVQIPYCQELIGHDGDHSGFAVKWSRSPRVDVRTARDFLHMYRAVPNGYHDITLCDDGTVTMTLAAFSAATRFIGLRGSGD